MDPMACGRHEESGRGGERMKDMLMTGVLGREYSL